MYLWILVFITIRGVMRRWWFNSFSFSPRVESCCFCALVSSCVGDKIRDKEGKEERRWPVIDTQITANKPFGRECKQQKEFSLSPFWHSHFSSKKHNGPNQFSSSSQQQLHPYFKFHFPPTVPIKNSSNKMSYAYLFKYIIIGDTGVFKLLR